MYDATRFTMTDWRTRDEGELLQSNERNWDVGRTTQRLGRSLHFDPNNIHDEVILNHGSSTLGCVGLYSSAPNFPVLPRSIPPIHPLFPTGSNENCSTCSILYNNTWPQNQRRPMCRNKESSPKGPAASGWYSASRHFVASSVSTSVPTSPHPVAGSPPHRFQQNFQHLFSPDNLSTNSQLQESGTSDILKPSGFTNVYQPVRPTMTPLLTQTALADHSSRASTTQAPERGIAPARLSSSSIEFPSQSPPPCIPRNRVQTLNCPSELEQLFEIQETLGACAQYRGSTSRPELKEGRVRASLTECVIKSIRKDRLPGCTGGVDEWRNVSSYLLNLPYHRNLMRMYAVMECSARFYVVTEKLKGGELFDYFLSEHAVPEETCKYIMVQLGQVIDFLHTNSIIHRDIKPENLMFRFECTDLDHTVGLADEAYRRSHELCLIDFDTCKVMDGRPQPKMNSRKRLVGTYGYLAPEILAGGEYSPRSDLWSVGVVLYILMTGIAPLPLDVMVGAKETLEALIRVRQRGIDFDVPPFPDFPLARDLCMKLLEFHPAKRIQSASEMLQHRWLRYFVCPLASNIVNPRNAVLPIQPPTNFMESWSGQEENSWNSKEPGGQGVVEMDGSLSVESSCMKPTCSSVSVTLTSHRQRTSNSSTTASIRHQRFLDSVDDATCSHVGSCSNAGGVVPTVRSGDPFESSGM